MRPPSWSSATKLCDADTLTTSAKIENKLWTGVKDTVALDVLDHILLSLVLRYFLARGTGAQSRQNDAAHQRDFPCLHQKIG